MKIIKKDNFYDRLTISKNRTILKLTPITYTNHYFRYQRFAIFIEFELFKFNVDFPTLRGIIIKDFEQLSCKLYNDSKIVKYHFIEPTSTNW